MFSLNFRFIDFVAGNLSIIRTRHFGKKEYIDRYMFKGKPPSSLFLQTYIHIIRQFFICIRCKFEFNYWYLWGEQNRPLYVIGLIPATRQFLSALNFGKIIYIEFIVNVWYSKYTRWVISHSEKLSLCPNLLLVTICI